MQPQIDSDGMPYWNQYFDTAVFYGFDWNRRMGALGRNLTVDNLHISSDTSEVQPAFSRYASGIHAFFVEVSSGTVGMQPVFTSKIFFSDGQVDKARLRVKVI